VIAFAVHYRVLKFGAEWTAQRAVEGPAQEFLMRSVWALSSAFLVPVAIGSIVASFWTIRRLPPAHLKSAFLLGSILVAIAASIAFHMGDVGGGAGTFLISGGASQLGLPIDPIVEANSVLSGIAVALIPLAAAAMISAVVTSSSADAIRVAFESLTANLVASAVFLVVGSLEIRFLYQWLGIVLRASPDVAKALSFGGAVLYTAILVHLSADFDRPRVARAPPHAGVGGFRKGRG
jgi:hypothetical protein